MKNHFIKARFVLVTVIAISLLTWAANSLSVVKAEDAVCYVSPTYGWAVAWGPSWKKADSSSDGQTDYVRFESGDTYWEYWGVPWIGLDAAEGLNQFLETYRSDRNDIQIQQIQEYKLPSIYEGINTEGERVTEYLTYREGFVIVNSWDEALPLEQRKSLSFELSFAEYPYEINCEDSGSTASSGQGPTTVDEFVAGMLGEPFPQNLLPSGIEVLSLTPTMDSLSVVYLADMVIEVETNNSRWSVAYGFDQDDSTGATLFDEARQGLVGGGFEISEHESGDLKTIQATNFGGMFFSIAYVGVWKGIVFTSGVFGANTINLTQADLEEEAAALVEVMKAQLTHIEGAFSAGEAVTTLEATGTTPPTSAIKSIPPATSATKSIPPPTSTLGGSVTATINLKDFFFDPADVTIHSGDSITFKNVGLIKHTWSVEALSVDVVLEPGESQTISIVGDPGTYEIVCTEAGHKEAGMRGTLVIA